MNLNVDHINAWLHTVKAEQLLKAVDGDHIWWFAIIIYRNPFAEMP